MLHGVHLSGHEFTLCQWPIQDSNPSINCLLRPKTHFCSWPILDSLKNKQNKVAVSLFVPIMADKNQPKREVDLHSPCQREGIQPAEPPQALQMPTLEVDLDGAIVPPQLLWIGLQMDLRLRAVVLFFYV